LYDLEYGILSPAEVDALEKKQLSQGDWPDFDFVDILEAGLFACDVNMVSLFVFFRSSFGSGIFWEFFFKGGASGFEILLFNGDLSGL
jgi:hypothetical protein